MRLNHHPVNDYDDQEGEGESRVGISCFERSNRQRNFSPSLSEAKWRRWPYLVRRRGPPFSPLIGGGDGLIKWPISRQIGIAIFHHNDVTSACLFEIHNFKSLKDEGNTKFVTIQRWIYSNIKVIVGYLSSPRGQIRPGRGITQPILCFRYHICTVSCQLIKKVGYYNIG